MMTVNSSSVNSDNPSPNLIAYAMTKAGIANFTASLAQLYAEKGIRANSVAPGPIWTPLNPPFSSAIKPGCDPDIPGRSEMCPLWRGPGR